MNTEISIYDEGGYWSVVWRVNKVPISINQYPTWREAKKRALEILTNCNPTVGNTVGK